jgi:hypothetical protein
MVWVVEMGFSCMEAIVETRQSVVMKLKGGLAERSL